MNWGLSDYLDVLQTLVGTNYIYFTSNKSSIIELCDWIGKNNALGNPFIGSEKVEFNAHMNYNSSYTDIMLYKKTDRSSYKEVSWLLCKDTIFCWVDNEFRALYWRKIHIKKCRLSTIYVILKRHSFFILLVLKICTFGFADYIKLIPNALFIMSWSSV